MAKKRNQFRLEKEVCKLARERVGPVPAARVIESKKTRRKLKHPKREKECWMESV